MHGRTAASERCWSSTSKAACMRFRPARWRTFSLSQRWREGSPHSLRVVLSSGEPCWLVAFGKGCIDFKAWDEASWNHMLRFQRVVDVVPLLAQTTARFESRHQDICSLLSTTSGTKRSRWKILPHRSAASKEHVQLNRMEDLARLLLKAQVSVVPKWLATTSDASGEG